MAQTIQQNAHVIALHHDGYVHGKVVAVGEHDQASVAVSHVAGRDCRFRTAPAGMQVNVVASQCQPVGVDFLS